MGKKKPLPLLSSLPDRKTITRRLLIGDPWVVTDNLSYENLEHFLSNFYNEAVAALKDHPLQIIDGLPAPASIYVMEQLRAGIFELDAEETFEHYFESIRDSPLDVQDLEVQANALQMLRSIWRICVSLSDHRSRESRSQCFEYALFEMLNLVFAAVRVDMKFDLQQAILGNVSSRMGLKHGSLAGVEAKRKRYAPAIDAKKARIRILAEPRVKKNKSQNLVTREILKNWGDKDPPSERTIKKYLNELFPTAFK